MPFGVISGIQQQRMEEYNAEVAEAQGRAESAAIEAEAGRLADEQREEKATQRVMTAQAGGGLASGQNIMILAEQAQKMQMDQLELQRQSDIAVQRGESQSLLAKERGKQALIAGIGQSVQRGASMASGGMG